MSLDGFDAADIPFLESWSEDEILILQQDPNFTCFDPELGNDDHLLNEFGHPHGCECIRCGMPFAFLMGF